MDEEFSFMSSAFTCLFATQQLPLPLHTHAEILSPKIYIAPCSVVSTYTTRDSIMKFSIPQRKKIFICMCAEVDAARGIIIYVLTVTQASRLMRRG